MNPGIVSVRVAFVLRSTEIFPALLRFVLPTVDGEEYFSPPEAYQVNESFKMKAWVPLGSKPDGPASLKAKVSDAFNLML